MSKETKKEMFCSNSACGRSMTRADGASVIGVAITLDKNVSDIYPEFPDGAQFHFCYVCWLRSLGAKF